MIDKLLHSRTVKITLAWVLVISFVILAFSIAYPAMKRAEKIDYLGKNALAYSGSLSTSLSYFAAEDLQGLMNEPNGGESYKNLCGLLARVKESNNLDRVYVLYKQNNKYLYLLDANYRDNATAGVDYNAVGSAFTGAVQSKTKGTLDKVYSQKLPSGYSRDIVTTNDHREVVVSYTPIYDQNGQVMAVLAVESGTALANSFSPPGIIDFSQIAVLSGVVFFGAMLVALALRNWRKVRELKAKQQEEAAQEARAEKVEAEVVQLPVAEEPAQPEGPLPQSPSEEEKPDENTPSQP